MLSSPHQRASAQKTTFGVEFDLITFDELIDRIDITIRHQDRLVIGYLNLHGAYLYRTNLGLRRFIQRAHVVYADGMPLMFWRRLLWKDGHPEQRFTLTHSMIEFMTMCRDRSWGVFYLGSEQHVLDAGIARIKSEVPGLRLYSRNGFFSKEDGSSDTQAIVDEIDASGANILMVGMGMPVQEQWVQLVAHRVKAPVIWTVGGAIEYYSGYVPLAPVWLNRLGLEWAYRLAQQPSRFAHRYLIEPFSLLPAITADLKCWIDSWRK